MIESQFYNTCKSQFKFVIKSFSELKQNSFSWWDSVQSRISSNLIDKLRWSTLGFHHDWDTKVYSDNNVSVFPEELASLSKRILRRVRGFESLDYRPEAAIVNFYPMDSSIGGHTDHSEPNKTAPLGKHPVMNLFS